MFHDINFVTALDSRFGLRFKFCLGVKESPNGGGGRFKLPIGGGGGSKGGAPERFSGGGGRSEEDNEGGGGGGGGGSKLECSEFDKALIGSSILVSLLTRFCSIGSLYCFGSIYIASLKKTDLRLIDCLPTI